MSNAAITHSEPHGQLVIETITQTFGHTDIQAGRQTVITSSDSVASAYPQTSDNWPITCTAILDEFARSKASCPSCTMSKKKPDLGSPLGGKLRPEQVLSASPT